MQASLLGSFFIFIGTGIYALITQKISFTEDPWIKSFVSLTILFLGCYFFYIEAYTEMDSEMRDRLKSAPVHEWWLRVINQVLLLSLWFFLEKDPIYYHAVFVLIFLLFLLWDLVVWDYLPNKKLCWLDSAGFLLSGCYFYLNVYSSKTSITCPIFFFMGIIMVFFILITLLGVVSTKFNPLNKSYRTKPSLH